MDGLILNKISLDWLLTLPTQPSTSKLSDNPAPKQINNLYYSIFKDRIVLQIETPLVIKLKKENLNPIYCDLYFLLIYSFVLFNFFLLDIVNLFYFPC